MKELFYGHNKYTGKFDMLTGNGRAFRNQFKKVAFLGMKELVGEDFDGHFDWALYFRGVNDDLLCISVSSDAFSADSLGTLRSGENATVSSLRDGKTFKIKIQKYE